MSDQSVTLYPGDTLTVTVSAGQVDESGGTPAPTPEPAPPAAPPVDDGSAPTDSTPPTTNPGEGVTPLDAGVQGAPDTLGGVG